MTQPEEVELTWMPLYWSRFMKGTSHMDATQIGAYLLLIKEQWHKGSIPQDKTRLLNIARLGSGKKAMEALIIVLEKFNPNAEGNLENSTCREIWNTQHQKYLTGKERAKKGGDAKAKKRAASVLQADSEQCLTDADKKIEDIRLTNVSNHHQHAHDVFADRFFSEAGELDRQNIEIQLATKREITREEVNQFNAHLKTERKNHAHASQWQSHLRNWLNTKPSDKKNTYNGKQTRAKGHQIKSITDAARHLLREPDGEDYGAGDTGQYTPIIAN